MVMEFRPPKSTGVLEPNTCIIFRIPLNARDQTVILPCVSTQSFPQQRGPPATSSFFLLPQLATAAILTLHADEALLPLQALQACEWLETKRCPADFNIHSSV